MIRSVAKSDIGACLLIAEQLTGLGVTPEGVRSILRQWVLDHEEVLRLKIYEQRSRTGTSMSALSFLANAKIS